MNINAVRKIAMESPEIIWFVARGALLKGPYTSDQLNELLHRKEVSFYDFVWRQGFKEWRPITALEDFDRRAQLKTLPRYPTVEVPCSSGDSHSLDSHSEEHHHLESNAPKKVQVSLSRGKRYSISIYEWGLAALFSIALAYFTGIFAVTEIHNKVVKHLQMQRLGIIKNLGGEVSHPGSPSFWEPLFSAPSFTDVSPDHGYFEGALLNMPVKMLGSFRLGDDHQTYMGSKKISSNVDLGIWDPQERRLDPVYIQTVELKGYLWGQNLNVVDVYNSAHPLRHDPVVKRLEFESYQDPKNPTPVPFHPAMAKKLKSELSDDPAAGMDAVERKPAGTEEAPETPTP